jgi:hypothetical protein
MGSLRVAGDMARYPGLTEKSLRLALCSAVYFRNIIPYGLLVVFWREHCANGSS